MTFTCDSRHYNGAYSQLFLRAPEDKKEMKKIKFSDGEGPNLSKNVKILLTLKKKFD